MYAKTKPQSGNPLGEKQVGKNRKNICSILFGGNYVVQNDGVFVLFRKSHRSKSHQTDRTVVMTAEFLGRLGERAEQESGR